MVPDQALGVSGGGLSPPQPAPLVYATGAEVYFCPLPGQLFPTYAASSAGPTGCSLRKGMRILFLLSIRLFAGLQPRDEGVGRAEFRC